MVSAHDLVAIDTHLKIDLTNAPQLALLHLAFGRSMHTINFWLNHCVFPNETTVFPSRLIASPWHLCSPER